MKFIDLSKSVGDAVYILSNNKDVGVIMDAEKYKELIASSKKLQRENEEMSEKMLYLEAELRLVTNKKIYSDEEVRSEQEIKADLSHLKDEWE